MRAFFCDGAFHEEHEEDERGRDHSKDEEAVEIGERGGLLLAQIVEGLQRHLVRGDGIAGLLEETRLDLREIGIHGRIERIEIFAEAQAVELIAPFLDRLGDGSADAAAFVAQQGEQTDGGAAQFLWEVEETRRR